MDPDRPGSQRALRRAVCFEALYEGNALNSHLRWPRTIGFTNSPAVHLTEWFPSARTGAQVADADQFGPELCRAAGAALGELHGARFVDDAPPESSAKVFPALDFFTGLSLPYYTSCSGGLLQMWALLQSDRELHAALGRVRSGAVVPVPTHGDIRLDQFLVTDEGALLLVDWEEFGMGDPAQDVGAFVGEWIHRIVSAGLKEALGSGEGGFSDTVMAECVERSLDKAKANIKEFWGSYRESAKGEDPDFVDRVVACCGWHLFDRVLAAVAGQCELAAPSRAGRYRAWLASEPQAFRGADRT
ncbi:hypothetical protein HUW46_06240 [Amycolatopsis sp. CA-230715]|nr:hypothetical protein HUW46_06240 [Amycolatopsis sp. CA-230715]